jgi:hypothetical protein
MGEVMSVQLDGSSPHVRTMVREQLLGDRERMADIIAGRERSELRREVSERLIYVTSLAASLGLVDLMVTAVS